jgi:hypothetical protein
MLTLAQSYSLQPNEGLNSTVTTLSKPVIEERLF